MTSFRVEHFDFSSSELQSRLRLEPQFRNWPVVYVLDGGGAVYVGETLNAGLRLKQHLMAPAKKRLAGARVVLDDTFNKSVCLDLESYLIRLLAGDGRYQVLNRNEGITNANYYGRDDYRATFHAIFDELQAVGVFTRPAREIENSDLFKLSPFKALTVDQEVAVEDILTGLFSDLEQQSRSRIVICGDPGTGKTVVAIFLMKLLSDIQHADLSEANEHESVLSEFFVPGYPQLLAGFRVGLIVPQQSLRKSIKRVFKQTPGLHPGQVLTPFEVGNSNDRWDLLIVDEAHRLNQRAAQAAGPLNRMYADITRRLFGADDMTITQADWIDRQSDNQVYLLDGAQSVRPADLPTSATQGMMRRAQRDQRYYRLTSQMRVRAGQDYVTYVRDVLRGAASRRQTFDHYDLRMFDDLGEMREAVLAREHEVGLSRLLAGYAWVWKTKHDPTTFDIEVDGLRLRWNQTDVDWVSSPTSIDEVGSIHTIQGYDLNYAGVIIGNDLRYDPHRGSIVFDRSEYRDPRGTTNNRSLGIVYDDGDILQFVQNIYGVLLTRGVLGTYVYACDENLREYLKRLF